jgi:hypothetical protein
VIVPEAFAGIAVDVICPLPLDLDTVTHNLELPSSIAVSVERDRRDLASLRSRNMPLTPKPVQAYGIPIERAGQDTCCLSRVAESYQTG